MTQAPTGPGRHQARERALELLYEVDSRRGSTGEVLDRLPLDPDPYALQAVLGIEADRDEIDEVVRAHSDGWALHRMPVVDRAILRLAVWELRARLDVPVAVVIHEAVELAKEYSTEKSPAFVNGVLDAAAKTLR